MDEPEDSVRVVWNTVRGLSELQIDFISTLLQLRMFGNLLLKM